MDAVLTGKGISVAYQQNIIIPSMDVEIPRGCVTSVIGPNGCGKSTLLKALSRMLPVRSGQVLLDGGMIARMPAAEVAKQMAILPPGAAGSGRTDGSRTGSVWTISAPKMASEDSGRKTMRPLTGHWR